MDARLIAFSFLCLVLQARPSHSDIVFEMRNGLSIQLTDAHFSPEALEQWGTFTEANREKLNTRRTLVLKTLAEYISSFYDTIYLMPAAAGSLVYVPTEIERRTFVTANLESIDNYLVINGRKVFDCQRFGIVVGAGGLFQMGFRKWVFGAGMYPAIHRTFEFASGQWSTAGIVDLERTSFAHSPFPTAGVHLRLMIHFDAGPQQATDHFKNTYVPLIPLYFQNGESTWGIGIGVGVGPLPVVGNFSFFENSVSRIHRPVQMLKNCLHALTGRSKS